MTELKKELVVELDHKFSYLHQGENMEAATLVFYPPNNKVSLLCANLEQGFYAAMKDMQSMADTTTVTAETEKAKESSDSLEIDLQAKEVLSMLMMGSSVKLAAYIADFESLCLKQGICLIDGREPMTKIIWGEMNYKDGQKAMGEYLANFLLR